MAFFAYQAKSLDGTTTKGELEAASEVEARIKIRAQQMIPVRVNAIDQTQIGQSSGGKVSSGFFAPRVKSKDLQIFTRQLSTLINSGIAVVQSLELLEKSTKNVALRLCLARVRQDISQGKKLADSLQLHERIFDRLYVNLVRAGEEAGVLDTILNRLATYIEKSVKIKNKVIGALYYPAGVCFVAGLVLFVIMKFVIPKFEELFKSAGTSLPAPTVIVINMSHRQSHSL